MHLAACSPPSPSLQPDRPAQTVSGLNQKTYLRLKVAVSLNLRRQIFVAVCDDLALRDRLAAQLQAELAYLARPGGTAPAAIAALADPRLVCLTLDLSNPDPLAQIAAWLAQPSPLSVANPGMGQLQSHPPSFQILGVERLTRQPALVQKAFLTSLQQVEHQLDSLESTLLIWVTRPWLRSIQQSAPAFWRWRTAVFEFEGDPTPIVLTEIRPPTYPTVSASQSHGVSSADSKRASVGEIERLQEAIAGEPSTLEPVQPLPTAGGIAESPTLDPAPKVQAPEANDAFTLATGRVAEPRTFDPGYKIQTPEVQTPEVEASEIQAPDVEAPDVEAISASPVPTDRLDPLIQHDDVLSDDLWDHLPDEQAQFDQTLLSEAHHSEPDQPESDQPEPQHLEHASGQSVAAQLGSVEPATEPATPFRRDSQAEPPLLVTPVTILQEDGSMLPIAPDPSPAIAQPVPTISPDASALKLHSALELAELVMAAAQQEEGEAIPTATLIEALEMIQQLHLEQAPAETLVAAYQGLGNLYRDRIEQGDASQSTLKIAICAYEQTLIWLDGASPLWPDVLNDIGNLYWMLSRGGVSVDQRLPHLEQAIAAYQQALSHTNLQARSQTYAMIQNNLGSAYGDLALYRDPVSSLQQSVVAYELALRYRSLDEDPVRYAATQNNLGTTYWNLAQQEQPTRNLKRAIAAYNEALRYYSPDREPLHYAMIQNNLGTAYWNLSQHPSKAGTADSSDSPTAWLEKAIAAYRAALTYRTLEVSPGAYAATQNNLGTAHWHLANLAAIGSSDRLEHLWMAIDAYKSSLAAIQYLNTASSSYTALTFDHYATHNNLGLAYYHLAVYKPKQADEAKRSGYLESSLRHHFQALQGWQQHPDFYQTALSYIVQTVRAFYSEFGMKGQNLALSQVPANLLPEVMRRL